MRGFLFFALAASVSPSLGGEPIYPAADWTVSTPGKAGLKPEGIAALDSYVFDPSARYQTDALLVVAGGAIVYERYARGYTAKMRHYGWSMAKSVSMALFGIAEATGKIRREDPVSKWVPEVTGTIWDGIRLEHLLTMSTGVEWNEGYESSPFQSHIVSGLYRRRAFQDFGLTRAGMRKVLAKPGERFNYSSGDTNLLMRAMKKALRDDYKNFPWDALFTPIGMSSAVMERDASGTLIGSSYLAATARDFARFGYLFLREGKWMGKQIIPADWVKLAGTPSPAFHSLRLDHRPSDQPYGTSWWLNRAIPTAQIGKPYPEFPDRTILALGHDGQAIIVVPEWDLVVVRLGNDRAKGRIDVARIGTLLKAARK